MLVDVFLKSIRMIKLQTDRTTNTVVVHWQ